MMFVKYAVSCFMSVIEIAIVNESNIKMLFVHLYNKNYLVSSHCTFVSIKLNELNV